MLSRVLVLVGAAAAILAAFAPWVTISGLSETFDLGLVGATAGIGTRTVSGTDTSLWPVLVALGVVVAGLTLLSVARRLVAVLGVLAAVTGGLLTGYMNAVIDIETRGQGDLARAVSGSLVSSSVGPGPPLLLGAGIAIAAGALLRS